MSAFTRAETILLVRNGFRVRMDPATAKKNPLKAVCQILWHEFTLERKEKEKDTLASYWLNLYFILQAHPWDISPAKEKERGGGFGCWSHQSYVVQFTFGTILCSKSQWEFPVVWLLWSPLSLSLFLTPRPACACFFASSSTFLHRHLSWKRKSRLVLSVEPIYTAFFSFFSPSLSFSLSPSFT